MHELDLADIQGGILRAYGRQGFPKGRNFFLTIPKPTQGRQFVEMLRPRVTTAARWVNGKRGRPLMRSHHPRLTDAIRAQGLDDYPGKVWLEKPKVAINVAFTFAGLLALEVPTRTLRGMPDEFMDGMAKRAPMLGDDRYLKTRDPVWLNSHGATQVHLMVSMNAEMDAAGEPVPEIETASAWLRDLCKTSGVVLLTGVSRENDDFQAMSAVLDTSGPKPTPTNKEHFGLSDGFGDPVFEGQLGKDALAIKAKGGGKLLADQTWAPLATGEFLLGYPDEAQEIPGAAMPIEFSRNGTFMAYRKLHENAGRFASYLAGQGAAYGQAMSIADPDEALQTVKAKLVGRWEDGVPLMAAPDFAAWKAFQAALALARQQENQAELAKLAMQYVEFAYRPDPAGAQCPMTSHLRRMNTRDMLDPHLGDPNPKTWAGSALNNRRRILRRGLPYGHVDPAAPDDTGEHGIIFLGICSSLFRQFEFVQQQWVQYGLDFNVGSDTCPIVGNHDDGSKYVIPVDPNGQGAPFVCQPTPQFVEPRGGDYFFIPSMTALRMIGMGIVDPT